MRFLTAYPSPRPWRLLTRRGDPMQGQLDSFDGMYASGRDAVYWIYRKLGVAAGSVSWMPAFHCGVEVQAAMDAGAPVGFYRILPDLTIDEQDLETKLRSRPGPVLLIHYFGFPQPGIERIVALCASLNQPLIEDCAHALFSAAGDRLLGTFGTAAIFSLHKTLPIYDGGALQVRKGVLDPGSFPAIGPKAALVEAVKITARSMLPKTATQIYHRLRWGGDAERFDNLEIRENRIIPEVRSYDCGISSLSRSLARAEDPQSIVQQRRKNWMQLSGSITAGTAVYSALPAGVCPLFFPVWTEERPKVMARLARMGVESFIFGEFAHPQLDQAAFPDSVRLRDQILGLPIHQQLRADDVDRIARAWQESRNDPF